MVKALSALLAAVSLVTMLAAGFLAVSFVAFNGLANPRPLYTLGLFAAQCAFTLGVVGWEAAAPWTALVAAGGAGLAVLSWSSVERMLASPHFEGYVVLLGALGLLQGALAVLWFVTATCRRTSTASA